MTSAVMVTAITPEDFPQGSKTAAGTGGRFYFDVMASNDDDLRADTDAAV
jgi:hypothetical protein